jgi:hypothetical protein
MEKHRDTVSMAKDWRDMFQFRTAHGHKYLHIYIKQVLQRNPLGKYCRAAGHNAHTIHTGVIEGYKYTGISVERV